MSFKLEEYENIFIAGAFGMVGSAIKRELINLGYSENKNNKGKLLCPSKKELNLLNYVDLENWYKLNKPTVVIIAAAKVGGIIANSENPYDFILQNLKIQTNIIEISWKYNVKKLLFLGSSCIYPKFCKQPIKEEYLLSSNLEETNEFYAIAKITGIKLCQSLMMQHKFNTICLMPTNLYGPGDNYNLRNSHVIPALIRKFYEAKKSNLEKVICWGSGNPLREFLFVEDLAKACIFLLKNWNPVFNQVDGNLKDSKCWINVGAEFEVSIKTLAQKISKRINYQGEIIWDQTKPDGTPRKKLNTAKINALGWKAQTDLDKGIELTLASFKKEIQSKRLRF